MANNFDSNFTRKLMMKVAEAFETKRVLSSPSNVNTQLWNGAFNPNTGDNIDIKRPTDYKTTRTSNGDMTGVTSDIITGKSTATVQDYITVLVEYEEAKEALEMGTDKDRFFDDIAQRVVTDLELDFARYAMENLGLVQGTVGEGIDTFSEVATAGALMRSIGVPMNKPWCYFMNPYNQVDLSTESRGLGVNPEVAMANEEAMIRKNFAGFNVYTATSLADFTTGTGADRAGTLAADPDVTYVTSKDTQRQTLAVTGFQANLVVAAGEVITITGRNRLNQSTRRTIYDSSGAPIVFSATVATEVTLDGSGAGNIVINGPAIYEATGAYNTVDSAPVSGDVVTLGGAAATGYVPNLFWHPDALSITSVPIKKIHATDTLYTSKDGLQMRCTKDGDSRANTNLVRFDLRPAYGFVNRSFGGHGYGVA